MKQIKQKSEAETPKLSQLERKNVYYNPRKSKHSKENGKEKFLPNSLNQLTNKNLS